ncbi:MAG: cytochrome ubiquinol oxidase subunit I [Rhodobacterales bacterium]|nr:cytochrome ubiquinol oxidase subunit I [Rhodobacterales bacterium]
MSTTRQGRNGSPAPAGNPRAGPGVPPSGPGPTPAGDAPGNATAGEPVPEVLDALTLARAQFAFTISTHILFASLSLGLASWMAVLEGLWLWRRDARCRALFDVWKPVFATVFGMGVVSGIVMSYEFGTNWSVFSDRTGPILGPLMGYEVLSAFFLEAGFLGVVLFGRGRVGPRVYFLAVLMVAAGTLLSSFWILAANSWMHTPAGHAVNAAGQFVPVDWWAVVFNPSFPYRLVHMVLAAYLTTAFVVGAAGAWHLRRGGPDSPGRDGARLMVSMALWMVLATAPLQVLAGDLHGLNTLDHQPAKIAAVEGLFQTRHGAPLVLFALPDAAAGTLRHAVEIPRLAALILTHDPDGLVRGLDAFPAADRPPVALVFWSFRAMVGIGIAMVAVALWGLAARLRGRLYDSPALHRVLVAMGPSGFVALLAGWITTEVGRQPWAVQGLLRVADAASPVEAAAVAGSLGLFVAVYLPVFGAGVYYVLRRLAMAPGGGEAAP